MMIKTPKQKKEAGKAFIINYDKEIVIPRKKGYYIEAIIRSQVHIARISKKLLKEKFPNEIKIIDPLRERGLYKSLFFAGIIDKALYDELIKLWKMRCDYAHDLESVNILECDSKQLVYDSIEIIKKLSKYLKNKEGYFIN